MVAFSYKERKQLILWLTNIVEAHYKRLEQQSPSGKLSFDFEHERKDIKAYLDILKSETQRIFTFGGVENLIDAAKSQTQGDLFSGKSVGVPIDKEEIKPIYLILDKNVIHISGCEKLMIQVKNEALLNYTKYLIDIETDFNSFPTVRLKLFFKENDFLYQWENEVLNVKFKQILKIK